MRTDNVVRTASSRLILQSLLVFAGFALALASATVRANGTTDYKLGAGDLVKMTVFGSPDLETEARIAESGTITCPLIGSVTIAGLSPNEAEQLLVRKYVDGGFLRQPQINLLVLEYLSQKVSVLGHVTKPGQYSLRGSGAVLDVLAEAGGLQAASAGTLATLTRTDGTKAEIDLDKLFDGDPSQNIKVSGGDRLYVPRAQQFYVYGQVQKPGQYKLERNMTVSRAISASGGLTSRGTERRAIVKRRNAEGVEKEYSVKGTDLLQADDILFIKESLF